MSIKKKKKPFMIKPRDGETKEQFKARLKKLMDITTQ